MTSPAIFVDTDVGADDAAAIVWLLRSAHVVGFTTVFGNTSVEDATRNLLTLFDADGSRMPVTVGAAEPLEGRRPRTAALVHGTDGFWGAQGSYDLSDLPRDAAEALAGAARAHPNLTVVALGPLTNIALAARRYPAEMSGVRLVALGGAWRGGNTTPVAEFNIFADPFALDEVLAAGVRTELVTMDAFDRVCVEPAPFLAGLTERGGPVGQLLARVLRPYFDAIHDFDSGAPSLPDVAAAIYALRPELGTAVPALLRVITQRGYAFGQTIIGATPADRLRLVAGDDELNDLVDIAMANGSDLAALIREVQAREPDNALVVRDVDAPRMINLLTTVLCN
jgi:inosine-uridine nucleoside N-ribohydrolase